MSKRKFNNEDAGKSASDNKPAATTNKFKGDYTFVDGYLNDADRQWLESNRDSQEEMVFELVTTIPAGLKLSVGFDPKSDRYLATLSNSIVGHSDCGKILTSRASSPINALYGLYYRHMVKFEAGWGEAESKPRGDFD